jgi:DNA mismatch repair protein MutS2
MPGAAEKRLELQKILDKLKLFCASSLGQDLVDKMDFLRERQIIEARLEETTEAVNALKIYSDIPLGGLRDIRDAVSRVNRGGVLEPEDLLAVSDTLRCARKLKLFLQRMEEGLFPRLKGLGLGIIPQPGIEEKINISIGEDGEVRDSASPGLARIRRQISDLQLGIRERLNAIIRSSEMQKYLQENLVTMRGNRYVIPVKAESKGKITGLIHDQSSTGATVYIEPYSVLELNNELNRKRAEEKNEIERILRHLSAEIGFRSAEIAQTLEILAYIDLIAAKGKLSTDMDGCAPRLTSDGSLYIRDGRHPLIPKDKVVPISVPLGRDFNIIVVTGPNTGGKTVALKTVGLLCVMAQYGLHIPAHPSSELAVFEQVFVDIGDEQSIEQSLSTFSSHMKNIVDFLPKVNSRALVLLDELGAGTDPTEGSALAMAILDYLLKRECRCVATTHYSELKSYAYSTPLIENASVEFDAETLRPTYRLLVGVPGRSNAFEVAARLGLNEKVIERARGFLTSEDMQVADLITSLEENKRIASQERQQAHQLKIELELTKRELEREAAEAERKQKETLAKANREARRVIREAQKEAKRLLQELKTTLDAEAEKAQVRAVQSAQEKLRSIEKDLEKGAGTLKPSYPGKAPQTLSPGDEVMIPQLQQVGVVAGPVGEQGEVQVQVGQIRITAKISDLRLEKKAEKTKKDTPVKIPLVSKSANISPSKDLRGLTLDEAVLEVDKYLDEAVIAGLHEVSLIHGKGTGALRRGLNEFLKTHPQVTGFRLGGEGEGGSGVTVVSL